MAMPAVDLMRLTDGEEWLLTPVAAGWCKYESLKDGTVDLMDVAKMNEAIAVERENSYRIQKAMEGKRG